VDVNDVEQCGIDVAAIGGHRGNALLWDSRGPFDDRGDADAAFPECPLAIAQSARRSWAIASQRPLRPVVARVPEQGIGCDVELPEFVAQPTDAAVHGGDLTVVVLQRFGLVSVQLAVLLESDMGV